MARKLTEEQAAKISRMAEFEAVRLRAIALRDELAVELLREGVTYARIGQALGVTHQEAGRRYRPSERPKRALAA